MLHTRGKQIQGGPRKKRAVVVAVVDVEERHVVKAKPPAPKLERVTFTTSREMDFFSEKELSAQTGHSRDEWPAVIAKELMDNALDACEEHDIPPQITLAADETGITVADNGPGIPEATVAGILDFTVRVSSREAYCSPTRGAQGNALKTLVGIPYVLDPGHGRLLIVSGDELHSIACRLDRISQRAVFDVEKTKVCDDHVGRKFLQIADPAAGRKTKVSENRRRLNFYKSAVRLEWQQLIDPEEKVPVWPFDTAADKNNWLPQTEAIARGYALFNPHLTLTFDWFGDRTTWKATEPSWAKWRPNQPTSAHWYQVQHLERLIGAHVTHNRAKGVDRTVADFLTEFDGLAGSRKRTAVMDRVDLRRAKLSDLAGEHELKTDLIGRLLAAMKAETKPVHNRRLGQIGRDHFTQRLLEFGCIPESIDYRVKKRTDDGVPFVLESVFGGLKTDSARRQIYAGANWSPGIKNPFRSFGSTGEGLESLLANQRAGRSEPIVFGLHLAHPRVEYSDRGKSAIVVGGGAA
jgi:hypothetical protein